MALSNSTNWSRTRDEIITQALRKLNVIGTGETPEAALVTEAAASLNNVIKSLQAEGLPLWRVQQHNFTPTAGTTTYQIGEGATLNVAAPLKIIQAWRRTGTSANVVDIPIDIKSYYDYNLIPNKLTAGTPLVLFYKEPGANVSTAAPGTIYLWPTPDSNFITTNSGVIYIVYQRPFDDVDAAGDHLDFPSFMYQTLVWALADEISPDNGVPLSERAQIHKRALEERAYAIAFNTEEGSLRIVPDQNYIRELWK